MTSFKTTLSGIEIVNRAFDLIAEAPIASFEVNNLAARTANRWYKPTVAWLLERHHWNLATVREPLAVIPNTRSGRWNYAYRRPGDAAFVKALVPGDEATTVGYYTGLRNLLQQGDFERVGDVIFSQGAAGAVDYVPYTLDETQFSEEFTDIIVMMLASRFAYPIAKKAALEEKYRNMAQQALDTAITRNRNENEPTYGNTPTETELVRGATITRGLYGTGWPLA